MVEPWRWGEERGLSCSLSGFLVFWTLLDFSYSTPAYSNEV